MMAKQGWVSASFMMLPQIREGAEAAFLLALRVYLADIFLRAGLLKLQSWETTLALFEYEYAVPLISSTAAAWLGTAAEIVLPSLLLAGLMGRFSALGLLALNAVAAVSYPDISAAGIKDHLLWGWMCLTLVIFGCGRLSIDAYLLARWSKSVLFQGQKLSSKSLAISARERF